MDDVNDIKMVPEGAEENALMDNKQPLKDGSTTNWRLITIAGIISALNAVENSVLGIGEWPYMKEIDGDATAQFFGFATSASKCGHAVFALIFSIWSYRAQSVRWPLFASRIIAIIACLIYLSIEYVPTGKRYVLLSVYVLLGIANSGGVVLRGYIATCSSTQDRPRAFAVIGLSIIFSIIVGPTLQLIFSAIPYPGYEIVSGIRFHLYSAPIWFSFILTIMTAFIVLACVQDIKREKSSKNRSKDDSQGYSLEKLRDVYQKLKKSDLDWRLIGVCFFVKIAVTFSHVTMGSIMSIFFMVQYGWDGSETVKMGATMMVCFGIISSIVLMLYIFCHLGKLIPQHKVFLLCTIAFGLVYVVTYPFQYSSTPVSKYNETTHAGCNPAEYSWCPSAFAVNPYFYMTVSILIAGPSIPIMGTALDTVYSRILGKIDQSVAHGAMTVVDDIFYMIGPIFTTTVFTLSGVGPLWIIKTCVFFAIATVWLFNLRAISQHMY